MPAKARAKARGKPLWSNKTDWAAIKPLGKREARRRAAALGVSVESVLASNAAAVQCKKAREEHLKAERRRRRAAKNG